MLNNKETNTLSSILTKRVKPMPKKEKKVKLVVYLSKEVYDRLMEDVLERVNQEKRFRGVLSEVVEECARQHFGLPKKEKK